MYTLFSITTFCLTLKIRSQLFSRYLIECTGLYVPLQVYMNFFVEWKRAYSPSTDAHFSKSFLSTPHTPPFILAIFSRNRNFSRH